LLLMTQMPLWSWVFYLHTPLAGHPVPNSWIHKNNEYMMNHPRQLLVVFPSHIWKIKRFISQSITSVKCTVLSQSGKYYLSLLVSWIIT
jgi:hypothetical protein